MQASPIILSGAMLRRTACSIPAVASSFGHPIAGDRMSPVVSAAYSPLPRYAGMTVGVGTSSFTSAMSLQVRFASTKNPYTVLAIKQGATKEEIKKAYRVMARKHHPDAPGGNHEKFQEIQEAYESVKDGVWIQRGGDGDASGGGGDGAGGSGNRYSGFRYTTRTHHKSKVSYDQFYTEMHTGKVKRDPFDGDDDDADGDAETAAKDPRRNPFAMNEIAFQAWLRFIVVWCTVFTSFRLGLFVLFPPKWERPNRRPPPKELKRKPPPPKPLAQTSESIVA